MAAEDPRARMRAHIAKDGQRGWDKAWEESLTPWDDARRFAEPPLSHLLQHQWRDLFSESFTDWIKRRPAVDTRALVPGCGRGYDALLLAQEAQSERFHAVGIDISPKAVSAANDWLEAQLKGSSGTAPDVSFETADFFEFELPEGKYDVGYDYTFLCALPPSMRNDWGKRWGQVIGKGGVLVTLMWPLKPGEAAETDPANGPPFRLSRELYEQLLGGDFECVHCEPSPASRDEHKAGELLGVWQRR